MLPKAAAFFCLLLSSAYAAGVLPTIEDEYSFVYDRIERLDVLSPTGIFYHVGPYTLQYHPATLKPFEHLKSVPPKNLLMRFSFKEELYSAKDSRATGFESFRGGIAASPTDRLFLYANVVLDEQKAKDETYTGKKWRGLAGEIEQAFFTYGTDNFRLTGGRFASFWGMRRSLVLSPTAAMDGFGYSVRWGRLLLSYRLARLDGKDPERDSVSQFENRYFAGHRLDIKMSRNFQAGLFETVVFGGPGRQVELYYLNPILFYHGAQLNEGNDDNTFVGCDFYFLPWHGVKLYGQFLLDDIQVDNKTQADQEPDEYAFLTGIYWADILPTVDVRLEYSRVTTWTFNQQLERNRYLVNGHLIGGALGNDYDDLRFTVEKWLGKDFITAINFRLTRQGEGNVTDEWTAPWLLATGKYRQSFPSGVVCTTTGLSLGSRGFIMRHFYLDFDGGVNWVENYDHHQNDNRVIPYFRLKIISFLSTDIGVE